MIPQADPGAAYLAAREEIDEAIARVLGRGTYVLGAEVTAFESEFAHWLGARFALGCASGTDGLVLSLRALGVGPGHAVATVSHTAVATVAAIEIVGATPVLLDVDDETFTLQTDELIAMLANPPAGLPPIRAVIAVHLYGQPAEMSALREIADRYGVWVIEDCAQAHGALIGDRPVGLWGAAAAFSFYPTKNLGALGDAGAVVTADADLATRMGALRQYGWGGAQRVSEYPGMNSRLDELQAAVLRVKLRRLAADNTRRQAIAAIYDAAIGNRATAPARRPGRTHVFHQYVIRHPDRDAVRGRLSAAGVGTAVHYPVPVHRQPAYRGRVALGPSACKVTERVVGEILSLPIHPHLADEQVSRVGEALERL